MKKEFNLSEKIVLPYKNRNMEINSNEM